MNLKNRKIKNPPSLTRQLDNLLEKEVYIRINHPSNLAFISLKGILKKTSIYYLPIPGNKVNADLVFIISDVSNINENKININLKFNTLTYSQENQIVAKKIVKNLINKKIRVVIAYLGNLIIYGILKFNRKENFYYIQNYTHTVVVKFTEDAILDAFDTGDITIKI